MYSQSFFFCNANWYFICRADIAKMQAYVQSKPWNIFAHLLLHSLNKGGDMTGTTFPSMQWLTKRSWCHHYIYTASGKKFFLHCYTVTNGAGAKRGEKRLLVKYLATNWHQTKQDQTAFLYREDVEVSPADRNRPGEDKKRINEHKCQRIAPLYPSEGLHLEDETFRLWTLLMLIRNYWELNGS